MNLSQLYYFRKLAEVKHYTHAAEELFISQPTLSNSISQLERELGIPLFEREGRKIKLTKYGEEFYQYATEAVNALEKGIALAHEHAGSPTGSIDIGAIYTIQSGYLPSLIKGYRDQYGKDAQVNVFQGLTQPLLEDLESNRYELAFTAYVDSKPDLTFVPVLTQRLVAVVHRSDKLAWSKNLALDTIGLAPFRELITKRLPEVDDDFHTVCLAFKTAAYKTRAVENFIEFTRSFEWDSKR